MSASTCAIAYGDGNAPDVMEAVLTILREVGANIRIESVELGSRVYAMESSTGILPYAWPVLERSGVLLMAPVTPPEGKEVVDTATFIKEKMELAAADPLLFINPFTNQATARAYKNEHFAFFEPLYGEDELLPRGKSDPSPMLHAAIMMLVHVGEHRSATLTHNAWLVACEDGLNTKKGNRLEKLTEAIIERLGKRPASVAAVEYKAEPDEENAASQRTDSVV